MKKPLRRIFLSSIIKGSGNDLPLSDREKLMIKWFVKFELSLLLVVVTWAIPGYAIYEHIYDYKSLQAKVVELSAGVKTTQASEDVVATSTARQGDRRTAEGGGVEQQIRKIADDKKFKYTDYLIRLATCESGLRTDALNTNGGKSNDRGVFQINDYWHPEVSDECAYDIRCATEWTIWRIESGHQREWVCDNLI